MTTKYSKPVWNPQEVAQGRCFGSVHQLPTQLPGPKILEFGLSEIFFLVPLFPHTGKICFQLMGAKGRLIAWHF